KFSRLSSSILFLLALTTLPLSAQIISNPFAKKDNTSSTLPQLSDAEIDMIRKDLVQLTSANTKGRVAGTPSEIVAANYISRRFSELGLVAIDKNYQRKFSFSVGEAISSDSEILIDDKSYKVPEEARPLYFGSTDYYDNFYITGMN